MPRSRSRRATGLIPPKAPMQRFRANGLLLCAPCLFAFFALRVPGEALKPRIVEQDGFTVIGIEAQTRNAAEMTGGGIIPRQWGRFVKEGLRDRIPNKIDGNILAVYTGYASNHDGDYDYLLGARISNGSEAPAGMVVKVIPKSRYAVLTTDRGPVAKVVSEAWKKIWELEGAHGLGGQRAYKADFEIYDERSHDPDNSQVDIYVGIE
jgi:predicted transcriptional regulator YdeE